jgi:hypothetical protein
LLTAVTTRFVPLFVTVTVAPGTTAPVWSVIVPTKVPVALCASDVTLSNSAKAVRKRRVSGMVSPLLMNDWLIGSQQGESDTNN